MVSTSILEELLELSLATTNATSVNELAALVSERSRSLVGAANAAVAVVNSASDAIRVFQGPTATEGTSPIRVVALSEPTPLTDAIRTAEPVLVESAQVFASLFPRISRRLRPGEVTAMAAYPLEVDGSIVGACFFRFSQDAPLDSEQYLVMAKMVPHLAQAVDRITDRSQLARHIDQLAQSNRDLENFAAVVAHDLSAPVRRIGSYLQLLQRESRELSPQGVSYAQTITSQVNHLHDLLQDTLAYARVTAPTDTRQAVGLNTLVEAVVKPMKSELSKIGAVIDIGDLPMVDVEPSLIRQVIQNLVDNAIKYRDLGRPARIRLAAEFHSHSDEEHRSWWKIRCSDNGIGIDPDRSEEVFKMFSRLEVSDERPGTGVGLAFVKRVIERHHGDVGIEQGLDGGTCIWFLLPGTVEPDVL